LFHISHTFSHDTRFHTYENMSGIIEHNLIKKLYLFIRKNLKIKNIFKFNIKITYLTNLPFILEKLNIKIIYLTNLPFILGKLKVGFIVYIYYLFYMFFFFFYLFPLFPFWK